jgi:hypothetical protein
MTRLLDLFGPDLASLSGEDLREAIVASEGRTFMAEAVAGSPPLLGTTANVELAAAFGADLICLNMVDPGADGVLVAGLQDVHPAPEGFAGLARFLGRPVGLNLEPEVEAVPPSLRATAANAARAMEGGAAFVMITANPGRMVGLEHLDLAVRAVRDAAPGLLCFAGKMHHAGAEEPFGPAAAERLVEAGAQGVLVPVPGTVPGLGEEVAGEMVAAAHAASALAIGTIGTSQEGADRDTIRRLALAAKRIGVDVHHIGDGGFSGVAVPENVYAYSVAIRGVRHTWSRMARGARASWGGGRST